MITLATRAARFALGASMSHIARVAGLCLAVVGWLGCERKAPGPEECLRFADTWLRAEGPAGRSRLVAENAFDELVVHCLTEPYDRELVSCVVSGLPRERCRTDFLRRLEARRED